MTTGADGTATYTVTGGAAAETDTFTFSAAAGTVTATNVTATYVATLPVIATLTGTYASDQTQASTTATVTSGVYAGLFSTTPISATAPIAVDITKDYSVTHTVSASTSDTGYKMRILAKDAAGAVVGGMPITVTAGAGGHFTDSCSGASGVLVTTKTCYTNSAGYIHISTIATGAGNISFTFTAGDVSASQSVATKIADNSARFVTLTGDATGTTDKRASLVATVTDRFGNAVSDVNVQMSVSGVGSLGGGAKIGTFTTGTDGKISFTVESSEAGTTSVTARLSTAYDSESLAGYQGATYIGTLFSAAGNRSGSASVAWTLVKAADTAAAEAATAAAEAASDAAAEAIDAANAATDAANLAAEAADAATVAAEEARDAADAATAAVEELATQVATLMAALKAQITTLANTVAKIAKKVKA